MLSSRNLAFPLARRRLLQFGCGLAAAGTVLSAAAQSWPTRPVRMLVATAPGGGVDLMARALSEPLAQLLGQSVVVENRAGGSSNVAAAEIIRAAADGYTLLFSPMTVQTVNPHLIKGSPNSGKDLVPVALIGRSQLHLITKKGLPAHNVAELVALAKSKPGTITYSSSGVGTSPHLLGELFQNQAGISLLHVPYKGSGPALQSALAGETDISFITGVAYQHVRTGRLQMLAVASDKRAPEFPELPTMIEAGYPEIVFDAWIGIWAPAATPPAVLERISKALAEACRQPSVVKRFNDFNAEAKFIDAAGFIRLMDKESRTMATLIKERNISAE